MNRAVFLDRDGVINRGVMREGKPFAPFTVEEFEILPGVPEALASLRAAGYLLIVTTNQPDVARGHGSRAASDAIIRHMRRQLPLDDVLVCYHDDRDGCACRKPKPGMIVAAAVTHGVELAKSFMIGDRWRDIGAGKSAGCWTILVNAFPDPPGTRIEPDAELADLPDAARWILGRP
jgi:D-glycero-D-manno-heptose 1,7-bisphosphate phosphatase